MLLVYRKGHDDMAERKGSPFERLVGAVQKKLDPDSKVAWSEKVLGRKSETQREIDVSVRGTRGSARIFVAIEAKDFGADKKVGIELVEAFSSKLGDVGANKGIMVTTVGYTDGALRTAAQNGIDTCVLRPVCDEDWEGFVRHIDIDIVMMNRLYQDAEMELADGTKIAVNPSGMEMIIGPDGQITFFDRLVNTFLRDHPDKEGEMLTLEVKQKCFYDRGDGALIEIKRYRCRTEIVEGLSQKVIVTAPHDWIFVQHTPDGPVDEKHFLEMKELDTLAAEFKRESSDG